MDSTRAKNTLERSPSLVQEGSPRSWPCRLLRGSTIGILDVIFYNNVKSYQCHPHRGSSTNTFVGTPDISFSAIFSCILGGQSMSLSVRRTSTPSCFTGTSFPDESKSRFNSLQSMDNFVLGQTSPCGNGKSNPKIAIVNNEFQILRNTWHQKRKIQLKNGHEMLT